MSTHTHVYNTHSKNNDNIGRDVTTNISAGITSRIIPNVVTFIHLLKELKIIIPDELPKPV